MAERRFISGSGLGTIGGATEFFIYNPYAAGFYVPFPCSLVRFRASCLVRAAAGGSRVPKLLQASILGFGISVPMHSSNLSNTTMIGTASDTYNQISMDVLNGDQPLRDYKVSDNIFQENIPYDFVLATFETMVLSDTVNLRWEFIFERLTEDRNQSLISPLDFKNPKAP